MPSNCFKKIWVTFKSKLSTEIRQKPAKIAGISRPILKLDFQKIDLFFCILESFDLKVTHQILKQFGDTFCPLQTSFYIQGTQHTLNQDRTIGVDCYIQGYSRKDQFFENPASKSVSKFLRFLPFSVEFLSKVLI